jgi:4-amino-4-deoxy-L-arabinose transferase-like glycosyltransferase
MSLSDGLYRQFPISERALWVLLLALSLLAGVVYLPWLGLLDLYLEEPRRAVVAANMLRSGEYLIPWHAGEVYLSKPPLFNWLIVLASLPGGVVSEISARLPSVLAVWALMLLFVFSARALLGLGGLLLLGAGIVLAPEFLAKGRLAEIDPVFSLWVAASLWSWFLLDQRGWRGFALWAPPLLLVALAFLTKREPALVFFYFSVGAYLLWRGRWRELFSAGHLLAVGLLLLLIGGWLAALAARVGWEALWQSLMSQVVSRGGDTALADYLRHLMSYPLQIMAALLPFSLPLLSLLSAEIRRRVALRGDDAALFAALACAANFPLYWFKGDVAVRYFMPMFPFILLLSAMSFEAVLQRAVAPTEFWQRFLQRVATLLLGLFMLLAALLAVTFLAPRIDTDWSTLLPPALPLLLGAAGLILAWRLRRKRLAYLPLLMIGVMVLARLIQFNVVLPHKALKLQRTQNAGQIVELLQRQRGGNAGAILTSPDIHAALWFYARPGLLVPAGAELAEGSLLLLHERHRAAFAARPGVNLETLQRFRYENDDLALVRVQRRLAAQ